MGPRQSFVLTKISASYFITDALLYSTVQIHTCSMGFFLLPAFSSIIQIFEKSHAPHLETAHCILYITQSYN